MCLCAVLAQRGVLRERTFINYLKYLLYWKEPEYAKFLKYVLIHPLLKIVPDRGSVCLLKAAAVSI